MNEGVFHVYGKDGWSATVTRGVGNNQIPVWTSRFKDWSATFLTLQDAIDGARRALGSLSEHFEPPSRSLWAEEQDALASIHEAIAKSHNVRIASTPLSEEDA